ncbi:hypothetical protein, partial [Nocardia acidivorans]|uniref:hypothetical protein n=1 Tax=Nocardia acidivorans TaxID=404580 RepID=UPI001C3FDED9
MVTMRPTSKSTTRYEQIMLDHSTHLGDAASLFSRASRDARAAVPVVNEHELIIRDVAAGVAAPALVGAVIWMLREANRRGLRRLRFLSRDGQVFYELAQRLQPRLNSDLDLEYVYSSRLTWSLAATDPDHLDDTSRIFNSFMKSNATDLCARLGLPFDAYLPELQAAAVSLDPDLRADKDQQRESMRRFLRADSVKAFVAQRITETRQLLLDYVDQN